MTQPSRLPGHPRNSGSTKFSAEFSTELSSSWIVGLFLLSELPLCRALVLPRPLFPPLNVVVLLEEVTTSGGFVTTLLLTKPRANPLPPPPRVFENSSTVDAKSSKLDRVEVKVEGVVVR